MLKLKELREEKNLTQKDVAKAINTNQSTVARWEAGEHLPTSDYIVKLSNLFQCSSDYLLGREDDFGNVSTDANLSADEILLLSIYKKFGSEVKKIFIENAKLVADYERATKANNN